MFMNKNEIIDLFDDESYIEVLNLTNPYNKKEIKDFDVLYYLKSILALDNFVIKDKNEIKKLFFYYFYLKGSVDFDNNYSFSFKDTFNLEFKSFNKDIEKIKGFENYFDLWKNTVFLNKIIDKSISNKNLIYNEWAKEVYNIVDFFIVFTHECSELYAFSWEELPLFKWLINELSD